MEELLLGVHHLRDIDDEEFIILHDLNLHSKKKYVSLAVIWAYE